MILFLILGYILSVSPEIRKEALHAGHSAGWTRVSEHNSIYTTHFTCILSRCKSNIKNLMLQQ